MNIPDAKEAVDKEWDQLEKLPAWQMTKVKSKKEVTEEHEKSGGLFTLLHGWTLCHSRPRSWIQSFKNTKVVWYCEVML